MTSKPQFGLVPYTSSDEAVGNKRTQVTELLCWRVPEQWEQVLVRVKIQKQAEFVRRPTVYSLTLTFHSFASSSSDHKDRDSCSYQWFIVSVKDWYQQLQQWLCCFCVMSKCLKVINSQRIRETKSRATRRENTGLRLIRWSQRPDSDGGSCCSVTAGHGNKKLFDHKLGTMTDRQKTPCKASLTEWKL